MKLQTISYKSGKGWSAEPDPKLDSERTLVTIFGASALFDAPEPVRELARLYPHSHIAGCSTAGEIFGVRIDDDSVVAAVAQFERVSLKSASASISAASAYASGQTLARELSAPDLRAVFVLSDGLNVNGSELVRGMNSILPEHVVVTGGLAGDGDRFKQTWVLEGGELRANVVTATGLYGDALRVGHGSKGGWDVFGIERTVTRSVANVLYELDGRPALQLYKEYLGDRASGLPATGLLFPLSLRAPDDEHKRLVRTILAVDESSQSLIFAGDVPQGYYAQLMSANFDRLVQGAGEGAGASTLAMSGAGTVLAIAVSCVGRRLVLGDYCEEEIEATLQALPALAQQVGFYSYGEISPYASGHCDLHNQTMTLTTFGES